MYFWWSITCCSCNIFIRKLVIFNSEAKITNFVFWVFLLSFTLSLWLFILLRRHYQNICWFDVSMHISFHLAMRKKVNKNFHYLLNLFNCIKLLSLFPIYHILLKTLFSKFHDNTKFYIWCQKSLAYIIFHKVIINLIYNLCT